MKYLTLFLMITVVLASCGTTTEESQQNVEPAKQTAEQVYDELQSSIESLEDEVNALTTQDVDLKRNLLGNYTSFANKYPQDDMTAEYLFRAGKLANEIGKPRKAIDLLMNAHDGHPKFDKRTETAFLIGFIYENVLNDRIKAQEAYEKVIEFYPESPWAADAQSSIELLYLTDAQKILKFKEKNQN